MQAAPDDSPAMRPPTTSHRPQDPANPAPIALFGTSADPPTLGHRALLKGLLKIYPRVATWASDNPLKRHVAPLPLRTALLAALVKAIDDPRLEQVQALSSPWTVETLARARQRWPQAQPVLVIGSDLVEQLPRWRQAGDWLPGSRLAIAPRLGWPLEQKALERLQQLGAETQILDLEVPASASSGLRALGDPGQLPPELLPLLLQEDPYGLIHPEAGAAP
jgi:nicotinate-nucleotide adenylyltransferase